MQRMIQHEVIGIADRLEYVEKIVEENKKNQAMIMKMMVEKLDEIREHQLNERICQECSSRSSSKSSDIIEN